MSLNVGSDTAMAGQIFPSCFFVHSDLPVEIAFFGWSLCSLVVGVSPVFQFEVGHSLEVTDVVGFYGCAKAQCLGRDHGAGNANRVAIGL